MENETMKMDLDSMEKVAGGRGGACDAVTMCEQVGHNWILDLSYFNRDLSHQFFRYECKRCGMATKYEVTDMKTGVTRECTPEECEYGDPMF